MITPSYKALLIDLDGVIRLWTESDEAMEYAHGLPRSALRETAFNPDLLSLVTTGKMTDDAWRQKISETLTKKYPDAQVDAALAVWSRPGMINEPVLELVQQARKRLRVVLVTNATSRLTSDLTTLGLINAFDAIVNSSVVGHAKPSPEIFHAALAAGNVEPHEALFVDDTPTHVEAARRMGIYSHCFKDVGGLSLLLSQKVPPRHSF